MDVHGLSDEIPLTPEQLHPVPEKLHPVPGFSTTIGSDHLLAIGSIGDCMLNFLDNEKLMASAEMGLVEQTLQ